MTFDREIDFEHALIEKLTRCGWSPDSWNIIKEHKTRNCAIKTKRDKSEFVEPQKLIKHTIFTRKNDVNDA